MRRRRYYQSSAAEARFGHSPDWCDAFRIHGPFIFYRACDTQTFLFLGGASPFLFAGNSPYSTTRSTLGGFRGLRFWKAFLLLLLPLFAGDPSKNPTATPPRHASSRRVKWVPLPLPENRSESHAKNENMHRTPKPRSKFVPALL